jgi:hypothetical protein
MPLIVPVDNGTMLAFVGVMPLGVFMSKGLVVVAIFAPHVIKAAYSGFLRAHCPRQDFMSFPA